MKRMIIISLVLLLATSSFAQAPNTITYHGRLSETDGTPMTGSTEVVFAIFADLEDGTELWTETIADVAPDANGVFTTELNVADGIFDGTIRYLELTVDGTALVPRQTIASVPYALSANITDGSVTFADLGRNGATTDQVIKWNGSKWAAADATGSSNFVYRRNLNTGSLTATNTSAPFGPSLTITKEHANTNVEVTLNSRIYGGVFSGVSWVRFEIRLDGVASPIGNEFYIRSSATTEFASMRSIFTGVSAGSHTIRV